MSEPALICESTTVINSASACRAIPHPAAPQQYPVDDPALFVHDVVAATAARLGISRTDILGPSRILPLTRARQMVWSVAYLATERRLSLPLIGRLTNRDHTTVLYGLRRIAASATVAPRLVAQINEIIGDLRRSGRELHPDIGRRLSAFPYAKGAPAARKWQAAIMSALDDIPRSAREIADRIDDERSPDCVAIYGALCRLERDGIAVSRVVMNKPGHRKREWRRT